MALFRAHDDARPWLTLVVRASDDVRALEIARCASGRYGETSSITVDLLDPDGPAGVVVEDAS